VTPETGFSVNDVNAVGALCCRRTRILCLREPSVGPWARRKSGRSNARSAPRSGRWALLRMRNAKPAAKESCLYDHALTSISRARSCSAGWVEGSCEVRRSQMAAVALRSRALRGGACMPKRSISAASPFGRSDSNADDIDAYPGAPGRSLGPHRTSRRQMVLTVGERPRATVRERRRRPVVRLAAVPAVLSSYS
jgi:hypothetical protein